MAERIQQLDENRFEETIKQMRRDLDELKTKQSIAGEVWLPMHPQWDGSWTALSTYQFITGSFNLIDFDDWKLFNMYFEVIGFTDAGTGFWRLFNVTDNEAVPDSEVFTTAVGQANAVRLRSPRLAKYSGPKLLRVQHKIVGGNGTTELVNSIMSRIVFKIE